MNVWLVDATAYKKNLTPELANHKTIFFKLKAQAKTRKYGNHQLPGQLTYSSGLLRIATILSVSNFGVRYMSLEDFSYEIARENIFNFPDIVAFGAVCPTIPQCAKLGETVKRKSKNIRVVLGGAHAKVAKMKTLKMYAVFDEIIQESDIKAAAKLIGESEDKLINPANYIDYKLLPHPLSMYGVNLFTTTGCKFVCKYCHDRLVEKKDYALDGGLRQVIKLLPSFTPIHFSDSVLGGNQQRAIKVCERLKSIDHNMLLSCDLRPEIITPSFLSLLESAGFAELRIGFESSDSLVFKTNKRTSTLNNTLNSLKMIRDYTNMYLSIYIVTGLPGSTIDTLKLTREIILELLLKNKVDEVKHHLYVPYPTDEPSLTPQQVRICNNDWSKYDRQSYPVYKLPNLAQETIWEEFLTTESAINKAWMSANGFNTLNDLPDTGYPEYNKRNYIDF